MANDKDYGDETDFNEWVDSQYQEDDEEAFYFDPEYWEDKNDEDDGDEAGFLVLV